MRIQLLGTGGPAPLPERLGSALVISEANDHLLFDAGRGVTTQLVRAGIAPHELTAIFITHHHYDHIGNLGDLLLTAWHGGSAALPIIGPPGTDEIVDALIDRIYHREILFAHALARAAGEPLLDIREVVRVTVIKPGETYWEGAWSVTAGAAEHGQRLGLSWEEWPCLGYRIEAYGRRIVVSGDTVACAGIADLARHADVLVHCCFRAEAGNLSPLQRLVAADVIASSAQVGKIATHAGVATLILTHFAAMSPELLAILAADVRRDFAGTVYLGEDLLAIEIE